MAAASDLTTLAAVKAWLEIGNANSDAMLSPLITAISRAVYAYLGRSTILPTTFNDRYDGLGYNQTRLMLRRWPVVSIGSLSVNNAAVPGAISPAAGAAQPTGYLLDAWDGAPPGRPQALDLFCYTYSTGRQNIAVTYVAGYQVSAEAAVVPATPFQLSTATGLLFPYGPWASDQGVTRSNGVALLRVAGAPAAGQYQMTTAGGVVVYQFAAADVGAAILVSYGYIPQDLVQSTLEMIAERFRYRGRIGMTSKTLGGQETVSFDTKDIPGTIKLILGPYRHVLPI